MNDEQPLHPLVRRQLKRAGIPEDATLPSPAAWRQFLERVGQYYANADQERYLLERSLTISSRETQELYGRLADERENVALKRFAQQRAQLLEISKTVLSTLSLDEVLRRIMRTVHEVVPYDVAGLYWTDEPAGVLRRAVVVGGVDISPAIATLDVPLTRGIMGAVAQSGVGELVNNAHLDSRSHYPDGALVEREHLICEPIFRGTAVVGVVTVGRTQGEAFTNEDAELVRLYMGQVSIALENARLFEQLSASERKFRSLFERAKDAAFISAPDGSLRDINAAGVELLEGDSRDDILGASLATFYLHPQEHTAMENALRDQGFVKDWEVVLKTRTGTWRWALVTADAERDDQGRVVAHRGFIRDITARKQAEAALEHQALHDPLTDLPNRTLLYDRLRQGILGAQRRSEGKSLALLVLDLDRFKEVNDTFGHHYGDQLLQQLGQRLRTVLRASDTVARLGGDEFAVVLSMVDREGAMKVARNLSDAIEPAFLVEGQSLEVAASVGVAVYPEHGEDAETLLRHADVAMYATKATQTGAGLYSAQQDDHHPTRLALGSELRRGIEQGQLRLHYQPIVRMENGRIVKMEALARWEHPVRGLMLPDSFIPLAEQTGLIKRLGIWALQAAMKQCKSWYEGGLFLPLTVNLSMRNLHDRDLPDVLRGLHEAWAGPPGWLAVELTESTVMADPARSMEVLSRLRELGMRIAIDDFGTGYSSLAHLKRLPVDVLKIDKSFVREVAIDENDAAIVRSTIGLAHDLGLRVIAEGVEDEAAWKVLEQMGCDFAQGYLISRPMAAEEVIGWLADQTRWHIAGAGEDSAQLRVGGGARV